jgi:putative PIN family toxin of toxin-antitoxin system
MATPKVVLDTNVLVSAQRSRRGASSRLLSLLGTGRFEVYLSVALVLEYEDVLMRLRSELSLTQDEVVDLIDSICTLGIERQEIYYRWRPALRDVGDEFVLELAIAAGCDYIVTFNLRNFIGAAQFGIKAITPRELLIILRGVV